MDQPLYIQDAIYRKICLRETRARTGEEACAGAPHG